MKREKIDWQNLADDEYVERAEMNIWLSSYAANNPSSPAHDEADKAYNEAARREKPWLYQRAWNKAYASAGYPVSDDDRKRATPEFYQEAKP